MWTLPNILTLLRILMIPLLAVIFYVPWEWRHVVSAAMFGLAAATDWVDGYLARRLNQMTPFGAFLDPVADKLIVAVALILLFDTHSTILFAIPTMIIISREIVISALREWMAELGSRTSVAVSYVGKVKTTLQMIAITVLLLVNPVKYPLYDYIGIFLLYVAAILTIWSMCIYLAAAWPELKGSSDGADRRTKTDRRSGVADRRSDVDRRSAKVDNTEAE